MNKLRCSRAALNLEHFTHYFLSLSRHSQQLHIIKNAQKTTAPPAVARPRRFSHHHYTHFCNSDIKKKKEIQIINSCQSHPVLPSSSFASAVIRPLPHVPRKVDYREETSCMGGSKHVNYTRDSSSLSTHFCSFPSVFRSEICLLSRRSVHARAPFRHLPKEWQLTRSQNILAGLNPAWLQRRGSTELSCRRRKRAGLHADGKTKTSEEPVENDQTGAELLIKTRLG